MKGNSKLGWGIVFCLFIFPLFASFSAAVVCDASTEPIIFADTMPTEALIYEDTAYYYDINASDPNPGQNATLNFSDTTDLFNINPATGVISFTPTHAQVGIYNSTTALTVDIVVEDNETCGDVAFWGFEIVEVNDMPVLTIGNFSINEDVYVYYDVNATDEEDGGEDAGNLTFWINDTTLFNISASTGEFNFTPVNADVGLQSFNISVNDSQGGITSAIMEITVVNVNDAPIIIWACNGTQSFSEDSEVFCYVNATEVDVGDELSFYANYTWFEINNSVQSLSNQMGYTEVNFTPNDTAVGNWWVNITVNDSSNEIDSDVISFNISNVVDPPDFPDMSSGFIAYVDVNFAYHINATDNDTLTPDGDTIYFSDNGSLFEVNLLSGDINFTAATGDIGLHYINISVNDSYGSDVSQVVNFTVVSDTVPSINMITNQSITEGVEFFYNFSLNVTDPDHNETMTYSDNSSLFDINSTTGEINVTADDEFVGENWVNLTVTDAVGAKGSVIANFTVFNVEDIPAFTNITNISATEDTAYYYDINVSDGDLDIPAGNLFGISEVLHFFDNTTIFNISQTSGEINFTVTNDSGCGEFWINISVNDSTNNLISLDINVTIYAVNDMPVLNAMTELNSTEDVYFYYDANATDEEDGGESSGNLTFSDNSTLFNISASTGEFNFTPANANVGAHYVNISVNDSRGGIVSEIVKVNVENTNDAPTIVAKTPTTYNVSTTENVNITFVCQGNDADGDTMNYLWYDGSVLRETDSSASGSENYVFDANYTTEGEHNITIIVSDNKANISYSWNLTVNHTNAPVKFNTDIANITWVQDTSYTQLDLDSYFSDVDRGDPLYNQTLNTTSIHLYENNSVMPDGVSFISISVNNQTGQVTFTPSSSSSGVEAVYFIVNDTLSWISSNNVSLNVSATVTTTTTTTTTTSSGGGGGGGSSTKYESLNIVHSGTASMFTDGTIVTPIEIKNSGDKTLNGIRLSPTSTLDNISMSLEYTYIRTLRPGESKMVNVMITGMNLSFGKYEVGIKAEVSSPPLTDSVKFFIEVIKEEEMKAKARKQLVFVHDFMKTNPECLELQEIIDKAENAFEKEDFVLVLKLSEDTVQACKEIIRRERLPYVPKKEDLMGILLAVGVFLTAFFVILGIYNYVRKKRIKSGYFLRWKVKKRRR